MAWIWPATVDVCGFQDATGRAAGDEAFGQLQGMDQAQMNRFAVVAPAFVRGKMRVLVVDEYGDFGCHIFSPHKKAPPVPRRGGRGAIQP